MSLPGGILLNLRIPKTPEEQKRLEELIESAKQAWDEAILNGSPISSHPYRSEEEIRAMFPHLKSFPKNL